MSRGLGWIAPHAGYVASACLASVALSARPAAPQEQSPRPPIQGTVTMELPEKDVWPDPSSNQRYWHVPRTTLGPTEVQAVFARLGGEAMAFRVPKFWNSVYLTKRIRVKSDFRKASEIRFEATWYAFTNSMKGSDTLVLRLDKVRELHVWYRPDSEDLLGERGGHLRWCAEVAADADYMFFVSDEDSARAFVDALASVMAGGGRSLTPGRLGMFLADLTPRQATDLGWTSIEGVLVFDVAIGGPVERAGIAPLDVILEVQGEKVRNASQALSSLRRVAAGTPLRFSVLRRRIVPGSAPRQYIWEPRTIEVGSQ